MTSTTQSFIDSLSKARDAFAGGPDWLQGLRGKAWTDAVASGLPTTRHESFKFTSLRPLAAMEALLAETAPWELLSDYQANQLRDLLDPAALNLIFVDGVFAHELSGAGPEVSAEDAAALTRQLHVEDLLNALQGTGGQQVKAALDRLAAARKDLPVPLAFVAPQEHTLANLNLAFLRDGAVIRVDRGSEIKTSVRLIHCQSGRANTTFNRVIVLVEDSAQIQLTECHLGTEAKQGGIVAFAAADLHMGANSRVRHLRLISQQANLHFSQVNAVVPASAAYHALTLNLSARISRQEAAVMVTGEGADVVLDSLATSNGDQVLDTQSIIDHRVPHTTSRQLHKSLLKDRSKSVFSGKIFVRKDAQKTAAFQQSRSLLLSNDAEVDAKPQLEIEADDVRCSHGATVAQLNADEMFYLRSRGIPKAKAEAMLCDAFAAEICQSAEDAWFERLAKRELEKFFAGGQG
jgi:Fe-S cluster assembly protein SufD